MPTHFGLFGLLPKYITQDKIKFELIPNNVIHILIIKINAPLIKQGIYFKIENETLILY